MNTESHNQPGSSATLRLLPEIGVVDLADPGLAERLAGTVDTQLEAFASAMREGLLAASVEIGLGVMSDLIEAEVTSLAGPKGRHDPDRAAYRHGSEDGKVTLGGRRVPARRPRVRTVADADGVEREVGLRFNAWMASFFLPSAILRMKWPAAYLAVALAHSLLVM